MCTKYGVTRRTKVSYISAKMETLHYGMIWQLFKNWSGQKDSINDFKIFLLTIIDVIAIWDYYIEYEIK